MIKKMMTAPCSLDREPYLCEWHADLESGMEIWIQISKDQEHPDWIRMGNLFEKAYLTMGMQVNENIYAEKLLKYISQ